MKIINYRHVFFIEGEKIELRINYKDGLWTSEIIKGNTGMGDCSGGHYKNLDSYIKDQEREHIYSFSFFNK